MQCKKCGYEMKPEEKFCKRCGEKVSYSSEFQTQNKGNAQITKKEFVFMTLIGCIIGTVLCVVFYPGKERPVPKTTRIQFTEYKKQETETKYNVYDDLVASSVTDSPTKADIETRYYSSNPKKKSNSTTVPADKDYDNTIDKSILKNKLWVSDGYRFSDSSLIWFSEYGEYICDEYTTSTPLTALNGLCSYEVHGEYLIFYDDGGEVERYIYDKKSNTFTSLNRSHMAEDFYMDKNGNVHEPDTTAYVLRRPTAEEQEKFDNLNYKFFKDANFGDRAPEGKYSIQELGSLFEYIKCYENCFNGLFCVEYDQSSSVTSNNEEYYLVTSPYNSVDDLKLYLEQYLSSDLVEELWYDECFVEYNGNLYYSPYVINKGGITYDTFFRFVKNIDNEGRYYVSVPLYIGGDKYYQDDTFVFQKIGGKMKLIEVRDYSL